MAITRTHALACLTLILALTTGNAAAGTLAGSVLHFDGSTIADAPVRVRNETAGVDIRMTTTAEGRYEFADLPAGTYLVSVNMDCCLFFPYVNDSVEIAASGASALDIQLAAFNVDVEGDDPRTVNGDLARQQVVPDLPVPRLADDTPDLSGVWLFTTDPYPEPTPALEWAQQAFDQRAATYFIDTPSAHCLPGDLPVPGGAAFISRFVQRPELLVILFEDVGGFRQVFLDGREHPENPNPTWLGHSIGRWEGDTLVVDTVGFNDRGLTASYPRTTALRIEERYTRTSYGELEVVVTYDDPGVFSQPWSTRMTWPLAPQVDVMEYVCENNQWLGIRAEDVGLAPQ
jgi:hypothetical protein